MKYALHCKLAEKNDELPPKSFQIFLSGGAGIGKSFLIKAITEYLKRVLRYPNQNLVLVTASLGKAAAGINGITLHSAFDLPVKSGLKSCEYKKPSDETLLMLRNKYQCLKVLIIDEIINDKKRNFWAFRSSVKNCHGKFVTIRWSFFVSCKGFFAASTC